MTDREMLELAAKAAGISGYYQEWTEMGEQHYVGIRTGSWGCWNPLLDNADVFTLAVKLGINLEIGEPGFGDVQAGKRDHWAAEWLNADNPCASVRRAITRTAAEIGRAMG